MRGQRTVAGLLGLLLVAVACPPAPVRAQDVKPIGKVVTVAGKATIEHIDAAVVQARLSDEGGSAKVGDPVYRGDVVRTGADGRLGINFADGSSFSLSSNATMDYDAALRIDPTLAAALYGRGQAKIRRGETASGEADLAAAKAVRGDIAEEFARYGVR